MRGRRGLLLGVSVPLTVLCLAGWVKAQPTDRPAATPAVIGDVEVSGPCPTASHRTLNALKHRLDGRLGHSPAYTGVALLKYCGPVDLYGTSRALLAGLAPNDRRAIRFHPVVYGAATLMRVTMKMADDAPLLRREGVHLYGWGPDMTTGRVLAQAYADTSPRSISILRQRYGDYVLMRVVTNPPALTLSTAHDLVPDMS